MNFIDQLEQAARAATGEITDATSAAEVVAARYELQRLANPATILKLIRVVWAAEDLCSTKLENCKGDFAGIEKALEELRK